MTSCLGLFIESRWKARLDSCVWLHRQGGDLTSFWADGPCSEELLVPFKIIVIIICLTSVKAFSIKY